MKDTFFGTIKVSIIMDAGRVNEYAKSGDANRNHVNYGSVTAYSRVLHEMGHSVDVAVWEDNGFLKIPKITIDGEAYNFPDGQ